MMFRFTRLFFTVRDMATPTCWICLEKVYQNRVRTWICPECKSISHTHCLVNYLTAYDFNRLYCPHCNRIFSDKDLAEILTKKDYKVYITKAMNAEFEYFITNNLARVNDTLYYQKKLNQFYRDHSWEERSKLERMIKGAFAPTYEYNHYDENEELIPALTTLFNLGYDITKISRASYSHRIHPDIYRKVYETDPFFAQFKDIDPCIVDHIIFKTAYIRAVEHAKKSDVKPKPLMSCPSCNGLVVTFHKRTYCSECQKNYCKRCGAEMLDDHVCDENAVLNFTAIKEATKPCPNCGVRIQRSVGCNQMFCVNCHTGFDWATGEIITHNFHNPHRMEWLQSLGAGQLPEVNGCNLDGQIRSISRSPFRHINAFSQMIGAIRHSLESFRSNDLRAEEKIYRLLNHKKSIKSVLKNCAGANYIAKQMGDTITAFIETSVAIYSQYQGIESDKLILDMVTSLMKDIANYAEFISKYAVERYLNIKHWLQYLKRWFIDIPDKTNMTLDMVFTKFTDFGSSQTLRDEMMRRR